MRKPSSSSKNVIAALVATAFGLTAGTALAQTASRNDQAHSGNTSASHRHASKRSVRQLTSQVKNESAQMRATTDKLNRATAQLNRTTHQLKQTQAKEMRVASAEHRVRNSAHTTRSRIHPRNTHPASTTPPPR